MAEVLTSPAVARDLFSGYVPARDGIPPTKRRRRSSMSSESNDSDDANQYAEDARSGASTPFTPTTPGTPKRAYKPRDKKYPCTFEGCEKSFTRPTRLEEHVRSHTNERPFECPHDPCTKAFLRQSHLSHHIKSAHTTTRDWQCEHEACGKSFATGTRLRRHVEGVHQNAQTFRCTNFAPCDQTFRKRATLQRHVETEHMGRLPFPCKSTHCVEAFRTAAKLRAHERKLHTELPRSHVCMVCADGAQVDESPEPSSFVTPAELHEHMKTMHPPVCSVCQYIARSMGDLQKHVDMHHSDVTVEDRKVFPCEWVGCSKYFTRRANLTAHIKASHEKQRRFVCGKTDVSAAEGLAAWDHSNGCGVKFAQKHSLVDHVLRAHLGLVTANSRAVKRQRLEQTTGGYGLVGDDELDDIMRCPQEECGLDVQSMEHLSRHLELDHGLEAMEIEETVAEQQALHGGKFWVGGEDFETKGKAQTCSSEALGSFSQVPVDPALADGSLW